MNKKSTPFLVGIPNMGVGLLWAMNMSLIPMLVATVTNSNFWLGALTSMGAFCGIFVQYLAGILSDRSHFKMGRRKPFILIGSIIAAVFVCIMPFTHSYIMMFITAFIFYFSLNFYQGPYYSMIPELVSDKQLGLANGFSKIVSVVGSAVIFVAGPMLWEKAIYLPFFLAALLSLASVIVTAIFIKEDPTKVTVPTKFSFDFIKNKSAMKLNLSVFFIFLGYGCITPYFVKYCSQVLHFTSSQASTGLLLITIVGAIFAAPVGILSDKLERRKILMLGTAIFAVAMAVATFVTTDIMLYVVLSFVGIGFIAMQITIYSILAEIVPPENMGEYMGVLNFFISLSQFVANLTMGLLLDTIGWKFFFPIASGAMVVAFVIIIFCRFPKYKVPGETKLPEKAAV